MLAAYRYCSQFASPGHPSSVDNEDMARHIVAHRGCEENNGVRKAALIAPTSGGNAIEYLPISRFIGQQGRPGLDADVLSYLMDRLPQNFKTV